MYYDVISIRVKVRVRVRVRVLVRLMHLIRCRPHPSMFQHTLFYLF